MYIIFVILPFNSLKFSLQKPSVTLCQAVVVFLYRISIATFFSQDAVVCVPSTPLSRGSACCPKLQTHCCETLWGLHCVSSTASPRSHPTALLKQDQGICSKKGVSKTYDTNVHVFIFSVIISYLWENCST